MIIIKDDDHDYFINPSRDITLSQEPQLQMHIYINRVKKHSVS